MRPVLTILLLIGGLVLIAGLMAFGMYVLDSREAGAKIRKKRVRELETALNQVENLARTTLQVDAHDLTAHQVLDVISKTRRLP